VNIQILAESWHIVLVVTPQSASFLQQTIDDVRMKSVSTRISVLAADLPEIRSVLSGSSLPIFYNLPLTIRPGSYWANVVSAHEFANGRTIFILSGTRVPQHWDARLIAAGQRAIGASAISPQCARHPILSVFASPGQNPELPVDDMDQWLNDYVDGVEYSVPAILESCALLQGDCWKNRQRRFTSDWQLIEELRVMERCAVATSQLYVDDSKAFNYSDVDLLPRAYRDAYTLRPPLGGVRHALSELSHRQEKPACLKQCLPVQLHVGHSWGGGLGRWMEDFIAADESHNHLVLRSIGDLTGFGQTIALYRSTVMDVPIKSWTLCEPVLSINLVSFEYRKIIKELVEHYSIESIVVSSLIGHSLDLLRTDLPTIVVLHDFFPFCPALYATFGSPCHSCTEGELRKCSQANPRHSYFKFESNEHWLAIRRSFIQSLMRESITVFAPTQSVVDRYRQLEPCLAQKPMHVVSHGLDDKLVQSLRPRAFLSEHPASDRLKIALLGRLTDEKGADLLPELFGSIVSFADIYLLGTGESGEQFQSVPGITVLESYRKDELGSLLQQINPDLGMLLSIVPETFSYTLSELWAAGIPVLATRLGAFADRISEAENGWLVDADPDNVLRKLRLLESDRRILSQAKACVRRQEVRTAAQMVADYAAAAPDPRYVPLSRYNLPRRSYQNPYGESQSDKGIGALYINHTASYAKVLNEFLQYSSRKMAQSPKLPPWIRNTLAKILRRIASLVVPKTR
jgi:glycosyltransferase involved in cell wall biosynthesis